MRLRAARFTAICLFVAIASSPAGGDESDARAALALTPFEKVFVLGQMRLFVHSVEQIVSGLATNDRAAIAEAAAARGARRFRSENVMPATLAAKLPDRWKGFGQPMRMGFDELARGASEGEDQSRSLARLGEIMRNCVGCHAAYRIVDAPN
jgi:hypothetical protein